MDGMGQPAHIPQTHPPPSFSSPTVYILEFLHPFYIPFKIPEAVVPQGQWSYLNALKFS